MGTIVEVGTREVAPGVTKGYLKVLDGEKNMLDALANNETLGATVYTFHDKATYGSALQHTFGEWSHTPVNSGGTTGTTEFRDSAGDIKTFMKGWHLVPAVTELGYLEITNVDTSLDKVVVKGDADTLSGIGQRYWLVAPAGVNPETGALETDPCKMGSLWLWAGYHYRAPIVGFSNPPGQSAGTYGAQTGNNKLGSYYCWNRIYDVQTGRWMTLPPFLPPVILPPGFIRWLENLLKYDALKKKRTTLGMGPKYPWIRPGIGYPSIEFEKINTGRGVGDHGHKVRLKVTGAEDEFCDDIQPIQMICRTDNGRPGTVNTGIPDDYPRVGAGRDCVIDHNTGHKDCAKNASCSPYYGDHTDGDVGYNKESGAYELKDKPDPKSGRVDKFEVCWACIKDGMFVGWVGCVCGIEKSVATGDWVADWSKSNARFCGDPSSDFSDAMREFNKYYNNSDAHIPVTGPDAKTTGK